VAARPQQQTVDARPDQLSNLSGRSADGKLAAKVASKIVSQVLAEGWPVGKVLGSSEDFLERYEISRAVFREAVRLLEHQQVAKTRRGPGGGLVVVEPSIEAIADAAVLYLHRVDARLDEVREARAMLDAMVADLLPRQNEVLTLLIDVLDRLTALYTRGDLGGSEGPAGHKLAEGVARAIYRGVVIDHMEPGQLLGSEPELMEQYGVSRAVFREAVRLLEHHQVAMMRRGPGGGLFVTAPSSGAVADVLAIYLARQGTGLASLAEVRMRLEVALVDLVIDRLDADGVASLDDSLEVEEGDEHADVAIHNLHANMARLAGNHVLELIALVLIRLTRFRQYRKMTVTESEGIRVEVNRIHLGIARAIQSGDRELARRRVAKHLDVLTTHLHE
jgi:DNA-binding FadR family transcriptional regulator